MWYFRRTSVSGVVKRVLRNQVLEAAPLDPNDQFLSLQTLVIGNNEFTIHLVGSASNSQTLPRLFIGESKKNRDVRFSELQV